MVRLVAVFADALGYHFLKDKRIESRIKSIFPTVIPLRTGLGYSPGFQASIWTSSYPEEHGYWAQWSLKLPYQQFPTSLNYHKWIANFFLTRGIQEIYWRMGSTRHLHADVPPAIQRVFQWTLLDFRKPFKHNDPISIFSLFDTVGARYHYEHFETIEGFSKAASEIDVDMDAVFYSLGEFDALGHRFGPTSEIILKRILKFLDVVESIGKKTHILFVFSDHGIFPVRKYVDILSRLKRLNLELGKDFLVFLDATMARLWFFSEASRERIVRSLSRLSCGRFLDERDIKKDGLRFKTNLYGDAIFLLEPSAIVYPSFWLPILKNRLKGAHGYAPDEENSLALFASSISISKEFCTMFDISPTILSELGIKSPRHWKGKKLT